MKKVNHLSLIRMKRISDYSWYLPTENIVDWISSFHRSSYVAYYFLKSFFGSFELSGPSLYYQTS